MTAVWTVEHPDYLASASWVLTLALRPASGAALALVGTPAGDGWTVTLDKDQSEGMGAGRAHWQAWATKGAEQVMLGGGTLEVLANLLGEAPADPRTFEERCLDAINAVIEGRASEDFLEMEVGGRKLKLMSLRELLEAQSIFKAKVRAQNGGSLFTFHRVVFQ